MVNLQETHQEPNFDEAALNLHIGRRLRRRRRIMGLTQMGLGSAVHVKFQQVQKYECAANRLSAARLYMLARALQVPVQYFFEGLPGAPLSSQILLSDDEILASSETHELLDAYYRLSPPARRKLIAFIKVFREEPA